MLIFAIVLLIVSYLLFLLPSVNDMLDYTLPLDLPEQASRGLTITKPKNTLVFYYLSSASFTNANMTYYVDASSMTFKYRYNNNDYKIPLTEANLQSILPIILLSH